ncbi:MAG: DUF4251 domain-containing protein [Bacteroidales bacterium]
MKIYIRNTAILLFLVLSCNVGSAQKMNRKKIKEARKTEKIALIDSLVSNKIYSFEAQSAQPMGFRNINLSSLYSVDFNGDSVRISLPYFGRAYSSAGYGEDGGINLDSISDYKMTKKDNNMFHITFTGKDEHNEYNFILSSSAEGFASLGLTITNKSQISFQGVIRPLRNK